MTTYSPPPPKSFACLHSLQKPFFHCLMHNWIWLTMTTKWKLIFFSFPDSGTKQDSVTVIWVNAQDGHSAERPLWPVDINKHSQHQQVHGPQMAGKFYYIYILKASVFFTDFHCGWNIQYLCILSILCKPIFLYSQTQHLYIVKCVTLQPDYKQEYSLHLVLRNFFFSWLQSLK